MRWREKKRNGGEQERRRGGGERERGCKMEDGKTAVMPSMPFAKVKREVSRALDILKGWRKFACYE